VLLASGFRVECAWWCVLGCAKLSCLVGFLSAGMVFMFFDCLVVEF